MPIARFSVRTSAALPVLAWLLVAACGDEPTNDGHPLPAEIRLLSPGTQAGTPGWPLPDSVIVEVLDAGGNALSGVPVAWTALNGADVVKRPADTTNAAGRASAEWTLGRTEGQQTLSIAAGDLVPVTVTATATIFHAGSVAVGAAFACALTESGQAFCWGVNDVGQLGNGAVGGVVLVPARVTGDLPFTALAASDRHACGLTAEGAAYCWGNNDNGQTGTGSVEEAVPVPTPVQTALRFTRISAGGTFTGFTCGLTAAGEAWCWGDNHYATLGDGTTSNSAVPVRVQSEAPFASIQAGYWHSCALATTGELWCWGEQESDTGAFGARPTGLYTNPVALQNDFRFAEVALGRNFTCGLTTEHIAYCWGTNFSGGLGNGQTAATDVPLPVTGGQSFVALSAASAEEVHALTPDGVVYRWGDIGNDNIQATPVPVADLQLSQADSGDDPLDGQYLWHAACGVAAGNAVYCVRDDGLVRGVPAPEAP